MTKANERVRHIPVFVVLPPRTMLLDVAGPVEVLRRANVVQDAVCFDVRFVGPARSLRTSIGLTVTGVEPLPAALPDAAMIVLAGDVDTVMPVPPPVSLPLSPPSSPMRRHDVTRADAARDHAAPDASDRDDGDRDDDDHDDNDRDNGDRNDGGRNDGNRDGADVDGAAVDDADDADRAAADEAAIVAWLRAAIRPGHTLVSICSGALLAARAGLLDGRACTTHHSACAELAALAPKARVLENRLFVEDGERFTSAGVTSGIDLMLHLLARLTSPAVALGVARYLVVYLRRNGGDPQLSPWLEGRNHLHPAVHRVQDAIAADPARPWTLDELARIAAASARHLSRLFNEHVGMSLTDYRNRLRVTLAHEMLRHTRLDMEQVAERAGFASTRQLRRVWRSVYETSPREARPPS